MAVPWSAIIEAVTKTGAAVAGGIAASKASKRAKAYKETEKQENQNLYDRRYNEDPLARTSAQRVLTKFQESLRQRNKAAAGRQAVMGGTEESVAAEKARNNEALAEAASRIAAQGDARKDAIEQQYMQNKTRINDQLAAIENARAQNIVNAIGGAAAMSLGSQFTSGNNTQLNTTGMGGQQQTGQDVDWQNGLENQDYNNLNDLYTT